jgi:hypothetical protein
MGEKKTSMKYQGMLYRYTTNGEGTFSAGRRLLNTQPKEFIEKMLEVVRRNKSWLRLPELSMDNLEFYWTEEGKSKYEEDFLPMHRQYLPDIKLEVVNYDELPGEVVYEDEHQVGIRASHDKSHLPNPYRIST